MKDESQVGTVGDRSKQGAYRELALDLLVRHPKGDPIRLKVTGNSMTPMLRPGDTVIVAPLLSTAGLQRGDIIVFRSASQAEVGALITHRLIGRSGDGLVTKGDFRLFPDDLVDPSELLGKVIAFQRGPRRTELVGTRWRLLNGLLGWLHFLLSRLANPARRFRHRSEVE